MSVSERDLKNRVALITGAARGIGRAIAVRLAADGARVVVADIDEAQAIATAADIGDAALGIRLDVTSKESWTAALAAVEQQWEPVSILVNCAGIAGRAAPLWEYSVEEWRQVIDIDLNGVFLGCHSAVPAMIERGYGRIVNIASIAGKEGNPNAGAYSASKAGVIGLTKSLAKELATKGIIVNAVTPAVIATEILQQLTDEHIAYMTARIPMGRVGQPEEVAALVAFLCSDDVTFSTGAVFDISGGRATY
ncbi:MAG TPA: SDR family NAD(P)-dependent oxidoreductase [Thermomicrobiales bacterium]|nr:SDR family NAD(P)-dependent oxidoreductase [Thermomicrobiales bacterium]